MTSHRFATAAVAALFAVPVFAGSASGGFHFDVNGGNANVEFNARAADSTAAATGVMSFSAPVEISSGDEESAGKTTRVTLSMKADFDCVVVTGNSAVMSGVVRDASVSRYNGERVIFAVEDNGEGSKAAPDKFTWGVYGSNRVDWFPRDAERDNDDGWKFSWFATDAERNDDRGIAINHNDQPFDCRAFALAAYTLQELPQGSGNIQVRP